MTKRTYNREEYLRNREKTIARARAWALANPERRREIARKNNEKRKKERAEWHQRRAFGITLERERCERCGTEDGGPRGLVIHHRDGCNGKRETPLNNDPSNLVVLCRACHASVHYNGELREVV